MAFKLDLSKLKSTASNITNAAVDAAQKGAEKVTQKSGEMIEVSKLSMKINGNEKKVKDIYYEIGKDLYENYKHGVAVDTYLADYCIEIDELNSEIESLKEEIDKVKNENSYETVQEQTSTVTKENVTTEVTEIVVQEVSDNNSENE